MLAPEAPYPLAGGGALRTASLLHYLAERYAVDLVVFREAGAPDLRRRRCRRGWSSGLSRSICPRTGGTWRPA
jgi:hypothetical protein